MHQAFKTLLDRLQFSRRTASAAEMHRTCAKFYFAYTVLSLIGVLPMLLAVAKLSLQGTITRHLLVAGMVYGILIVALAIAGRWISRKAERADKTSMNDDAARFGRNALLALVLVPLALPMVAAFAMDLVVPNSTRYFFGVLLIEIMVVVSESADSFLFQIPGLLSYWILWGLRLLALWFAIRLAKPSAARKQSDVQVGAAGAAAAVEFDPRSLRACGFLCFALAAILVLPVAVFQAYVLLAMGQRTPLMDIWWNGGADAGPKLVIPLLITIAIYVLLALVAVAAGAWFVSWHRRQGNSHTTGRPFPIALKQLLRWVGVLLIVGIPIVYRMMRNEHYRVGVPGGLGAFKPVLLFATFNLHKPPMNATPPPFARFFYFQCLPLVLLGATAIFLAQTLSVREVKREPLGRSP